MSDFFFTAHLKCLSLRSVGPRPTDKAKLDEMFEATLEEMSINQKLRVEMRKFDDNKKWMMITQQSQVHTVRS